MLVTEELWKAQVKTKFIKKVNFGFPPALRLESRPVTCISSLLLGTQSNLRLRFQTSIENFLSKKIELYVLNLFLQKYDSSKYYLQKLGYFEKDEDIRLGQVQSDIKPGVRSVFYK